MSHQPQPISKDEMETIMRCVQVAKFGILNGNLETEDNDGNLNKIEHVLEKLKIKYDQEYAHD